MPSRTSSAPGLGWPGSRSAGGERRRRSTPRPTPEHPRGLGGEEPPKRSPVRRPARPEEDAIPFGGSAEALRSQPRASKTHYILEPASIRVLRGAISVPETAVNEGIGRRLRPRGRLA